MRHLRLADKNWNDAFFLIQRRRDLDSDKIVRIIEPTIARSVPRVQPTLADDSKYDIAVSYTVIQDANEVETRSNIVDVQEQLFGRKNILQPIEEPTGMPSVVTTTIINENFSRA
jgi:hypothetical protein